MRDSSTIIRDRQLAIRRELDRRGIPLKVVAFDSGIPYGTLCAYFPGGERTPAELPTSASFSLCGVIPDDLLNLLVPEGFALVRTEGEDDHDTLAIHTQEFAGTYTAARHPNSPAGVDIAPCEDSKLRIARAKLRRVA